jgi:uncharacterized membrane protein (DUF485 family)
VKVLVEGYTRHMPDLDRHWLERLQVMGKVQSRYLWILLITMIFYGALQERVYVDTDPLKMPIVDVEISGSFVLGFGPALISFFVLAITGTMRATRTARAQLNLGRGDWSGEELDTSPNALDLAFYTTRESPKPTAVVTHFSYVAFLALGLYEAAWLAKRLADAEAPTWSLFVVLGAVLWLPAVGFVGYEFLRRVRDVPTLWRTR